MARSAPPRIQRSRRSAGDAAVLAAGSVAVMDAGNKASLVRIGEAHFLEIDGAFPRGGALRVLEDETRAVIDRDLFGIARDRVFDRFERDPKIFSELGGALQPIEREFKRDETRL